MKNKSVIIMTVLVCLLSCLNITLFVGLVYNKDRDDNNGGSNGENNIVNNITNNVVEYDTIKVDSLETAVNVAIKKAEDASVTIIAKEEVEKNGSIFEIEASSGSGVIYKRRGKRNENF